MTEDNSHEVAYTSSNNKNSISLNNLHYIINSNQKLKSNPNPLPVYSQPNHFSSVFDSVNERQHNSYHPSNNNNNRYDIGDANSNNPKYIVTTTRSDIPTQNSHHIDSIIEEKDPSSEQNVPLLVDTTKIKTNDELINDNNSFTPQPPLRLKAHNNDNAIGHSNWYIQITNFINNYWFHFFLLITISTVSYYLLPWIARQWVVDERYRGNIVTKLELLNNVNAQGYIKQYVTTGQLTYYDVLNNKNIFNKRVGSSSDGDTTLIGKGKANGLVAGIDEDGNDLDDDIEADTIDSLSLESIQLQQQQLDNALGLYNKNGDRFNNGMGNVKEEKKNSNKLTIAPQVNIPVSSVCSMMTQFEPSENMLRRRRGCYDMLAFMIHKLVNPTYLEIKLAKLIDSTRRSVNNNAIAKGSGTTTPHHVAKKYSNSKSNLDVAKANRELVKIHQLSMGRRYIGKHVHCVCNSYLGFAEPWVYVGINGEEPQLIIDPVLEALSVKQAQSVKYEHSIGVFGQTNITGLYDTDKSLWNLLRFSPEIRQPKDGITISYKTLPSDDIMEEYYGSQFGSSLIAYLTSHANQKQMQRIYENGIKANKTASGGGNNLTPSTIASILNYLMHSIDNWSNPNAHELDAFYDIIKVRFETQAVRAFENEKLKESSSSNKRRSQHGNNGKALSYVPESISNFFNIISGNNKVNVKIPELINVKRKEVDAPHSVCILHCMGLNEGIKKRRQEWRNSLSGDKSSTQSYNSNDVDMLNFEFL